MSSADAVAREVAWLQTSGDGLPTLLGPAGPFSLIQAYRSRNPNTRLPSIYVLRTGLVEQRWGNQRKLLRYSFLADCFWPIGSTTTGMQLWETEQAAFDTAIDLLITRVRGTLIDHTHGGRFLSSAEAPEPGRINVRFDDPDRTATANPACLRATVHWDADDQITA